MVGKKRVNEKGEEIKIHYEVRIPRGDGKGWPKIKKFKRQSDAYDYWIRSYDPKTKIEPQFFRLETTKTTKRETPKDPRTWWYERI